MSKVELILSNLHEIRRRSIILWQVLPKNHYEWKPDEGAMSAIEMIRHVLAADYGWNLIINQSDMSNYKTPWENRPYYSVQDELQFAQPHREKFLETIQQFSEDDLDRIRIIHPGNGEMKKLGKYLLRIGYHESVHAGQFLAYLRAMSVPPPQIWD